MLIGLPKSYQTFVSIQRALPDPPNLVDLILAVELEERTQDSTVVHEVSIGVVAMMANRGDYRGRVRGREGRGGNQSDRSSFIKAKTSSQVKD